MAHRAAGVEGGTAKPAGKEGAAAAGPGRAAGDDSTLAATASGLPSAATASGLAEAAAASEVENMKFEEIPLHIPGESPVEIQGESLIHVPPSERASDEDECDERPTLHYTKDGHVVNAEGHRV